MTSVWWRDEPEPALRVPPRSWLAPGLVLALLPARAQGWFRPPGHVPAPLAAAGSLEPADPEAPMARMILALKLAPEAEARLERRLAGLRDSGSASYHQWLTPEQFGAEFGPGPEALGRVTLWLRQGGFRIDELAAGRLSVTFSGSVRQVERTFRTPIRRFMLDGRPRQGNLRDPAIPRDLADLVAGVVSLHNIPRTAQNLGFAPAPASGHNLTPAAFAAIYNLEPLHRTGLDGSGVSIAVVGRTRIPLTDVARFRQKYRLPAQAPELIINGPDPGDLGGGEDGEANLDVQWAGAAAPGAGIRLVVSRSTSATDGVDLSTQYIVNHNLAPVLSTSFGQCEQRMGSAEQMFYKNLWAQAAAQGITSVVASGDSGPAGCNGGHEGAGSGRAVSGLASTPYNVAVGGTELDEGSGCYWNGATALGYIPERAWNESASVPGGSGLWATGGGTSSLYPKPAWQVAPGVPGNGGQYRYRCLPDVALAAAFHHDGYLVETGGAEQVTGGTSCATPAFAGIMALVVQRAGRQGNAAPALYRLGSAQYPGHRPGRVPRHHRRLQLRARYPGLRRPAGLRPGHRPGQRGCAGPGRGLERLHRRQRRCRHPPARVGPDHRQRHQCPVPGFRPAQRSRGLAQLRLGFRRRRLRHRGGLRAHLREPRHGADHQPGHLHRPGRHRRPRHGHPDHHRAAPAGPGGTDRQRRVRTGQPGLDRPRRGDRRQQPAGAGPPGLPGRLVPCRPLRHPGAPADRVHPRQRCRGPAHLLAAHGSRGNPSQGARCVRGQGPRRRWPAGCPGQRQQPAGRAGLPAGTAST